jgi:hypothetical protein
LKDGVIADFNAAELMIRELIKMIYPKKPLFPPAWRMVICIPSSITEVEKRAVRDSAEQAGAKEVWICDETGAIRFFNGQGDTVESLPIQCDRLEQFWAETITIRGLWTLEKVTLILSNEDHKISFASKYTTVDGHEEGIIKSIFGNVGQIRPQGQ